MLHEPSVSFQMFDPTPTFEYCKSWGVGTSQGLALGSAIRVRVGLGPPAYTCKYVYMHEINGSVYRTRMHSETGRK